MYAFYLDGVQMPVTPSEMTMKISNQNKTINLINDGEVNILKAAGLTEISFTVIIPQVKYPFEVYKDGSKEAIKIGIIKGSLLFWLPFSLGKTSFKPLTLIVKLNVFP